MTVRYKDLRQSESKVQIHFKKKFQLLEISQRIDYKIKKMLKQKAQVELGFGVLYKNKHDLRKPNRSTIFNIKSIRQNPKLLVRDCIQEELDRTETKLNLIRPKTRKRRNLSLELPTLNDSSDTLSLVMNRPKIKKMPLFVHSTLSKSPGKMTQVQLIDPETSFASVLDYFDINLKKIEGLIVQIQPIGGK